MHSEKKVCYIQKLLSEYIDVQKDMNLLLKVERIFPRMGSISRR